MKTERKLKRYYQDNMYYNVNWSLFDNTVFVFKFRNAFFYKSNNLAVGGALFVIGYKMQFIQKSFINTQCKRFHKNNHPCIYNNLKIIICIL